MTESVEQQEREALRDVHNIEVDRLFDFGRRRVPVLATAEPPLRLNLELRFDLAIETHGYLDLAEQVSRHAADPDELIHHAICNLTRGEHYDAINFLLLYLWVQEHAPK